MDYRSAYDNFFHAVAKYGPSDSDNNFEKLSTAVEAHLTLLKMAAAEPAIPRVTKKPVPGYTLSPAPPTADPAAQITGAISKLLDSTGYKIKIGEASGADALMELMGFKRPVDEVDVLTRRLVKEFENDTGSIEYTEDGIKYDLKDPKTREFLRDYVSRNFNAFSSVGTGSLLDKFAEIFKESAPLDQPSFFGMSNVYYSFYKFVVDNRLEVDCSLECLLRSLETYYFGYEDRERHAKMFARIEQFVHNAVKILYGRHPYSEKISAVHKVFYELKKEFPGGLWSSEDWTKSLFHEVYLALTAELGTPAGFTQLTGMVPMLASYYKTPRIVDATLRKILAVAEKNGIEIETTRAIANTFAVRALWSYFKMNLEQRAEINHILKENAPELELDIDGLFDTARNISDTFTDLLKNPAVLTTVFDKITETGLLPKETGETLARVFAKMINTTDDNAPYFG